MNTNGMLCTMLSSWSSSRYQTGSHVTRPSATRHDRYAEVAQPGGERPPERARHQHGHGVDRDADRARRVFRSIRRSQPAHAPSHTERDPIRVVPDSDVNALVFTIAPHLHPMSVNRRRCTSADDDHEEP